MSFEDSRSFCANGMEHFQASYLKIHWYLLLVLFVSGVVGNLINMAVLTHRRMRAPIDAIFTALAISHLIVLLTIIPEISSPHESDKSYSFLLYKLISLHVEAVGMLISTWLTLTLLVWGLIEVAFERKTHLYTMRRAIATSLAPYLICPIVCIPTFFIFKISPKYTIADGFGGGFIFFPSSSDAKIVYELVIHEIFTAYHILLDINAWIFSVTFVIGPCIALAVLTTCLIYASRKREYRDIPTALVTLGGYESNKYDELASIINTNRTTDIPTNVLIALSVFFIFLNLPLGILSILLLSLDYRFQTCLIHLHNLIVMLTCIYPSITCFLYCKMRVGFWDTMVYILKTKCLNRWWPNVQTMRGDMDVNGKTVTQSSTPHSYVSTLDNTGQTE